MSAELVKVVDEGILAKLDDEIRDKFERLFIKITNQGTQFEEVARDWRPSRLYLTQPTTSDDSGKPEEARTGDYFYAGGLVERPLKFLVAYAYPSRVRFVPDEDRRPSCSAENVDIRNYGAKDQSVSIYGDKCAECPYDDQPFRHGKPTNCNNVMNVLMVPESLEDIFILPFSKSGWSAGRQLVDQATALVTPWSRFFTLDSKEEKRKNGTGKYAVPVIKAISPKEESVPDYLQAFTKFIYERFAEYRKEVRTMVVRRSDDIEDAVSTDTLDIGDKDFSDDM
jgi:hypothetical protein